jgi:hypothetical protein
MERLTRTTLFIETDFFVHSIVYLERRLRVFENRVLRRIFGFKGTR